MNNFNNLAPAYVPFPERWMVQLGNIKPELTSVGIPLEMTCTLNQAAGAAAMHFLVYGFECCKRRGASADAHPYVC